MTTPTFACDAHGGVRRLVTLGRDEVGDHRLRDRAAERAEDPASESAASPAHFVSTSASRRSG